jgi:hypothetical protein
MPRANGPFKVLEKINENAYKLHLPADFGVSPTFNITDLKPYLGEEDELESRTTQMHEGEDDVDINTSDTSTPTHNQISGLITRARARQLSSQVCSFLHMFESRTTQMQEWENDEDITNMDTHSVVDYDSKVKLFFSIIIFNTCDEWTLHHDMCSMSFTEVLAWIKEGTDHA